MPLIDMPLEELKEYTGRNPKPVDFDTFWDEGLTDMRAADPQIELIPGPYTFPNAECFDMYFTGVGGSRVHAKYVRPKKWEKPLPALLQFHGYHGSSGEWWDKLAFVNAGFAVAALDCRGQSGQSEDRSALRGPTFRGHFIRGIFDSPRDMLFRQIYLDTAQLASIVMGFAEVDETRVGAFGGSQGGALTVACAALEPRIKRIAPLYPFLSDYKRVWEMDLATGAYSELREHFRAFDPQHKDEDAVFTRLGYIDIQHLAPRIKAEVLWGIGLMDTICPPSTQFAVYNKISSKKQMLIYPDFGHEGIGWFADLTYAFMLPLLSPGEKQ